MQSFNSVISKMLLEEEQKPEDYWGDKCKAPLLSSKPFREYANGIVPDDEVISMDIPSKDSSVQSRPAINMMVCATTGVGKDRFIKNIIKAYYKQGYRILHIEPKGYEFFNARYKGTGKRIHHLDKNDSLPVVGYCPYFIQGFLEKNNHPLINDVKFYSPQVDKMDYIEIWESLGFQPKAASMVVDMINKGHKDLNMFEKKIMTAPASHLHAASRQSGLSGIDRMKTSNFFGTNKKLDLEKEWDKGNVVDVMYMSRDGAMMNCDIGLILDQVRDIGINESKRGLQFVTKKLIIFNDAFYYAGLSAKIAKDGINLAIRNISNCQNNFRTWGVNTIFVVQSPDSNNIVPALIDGCTTKFISYTENPKQLIGKLPMDAYNLLVNTDPAFPRLYTDEDDHVFQWIYVRGKTKWETGFPFDCTLGHGN